MTHFIRLILAASLLSLAACATVADMSGYDSKTANAEAAKGYAQVVDEAKSGNAVDTTSKTAKQVQAVYKKMLPFAKAENKTGVPFDWELTVIRSETINAWAMPGGKMVVYTGIVETNKLTSDEIAAIMGHEMIHALHEHSKLEHGQKVLTNLGMTVGGAVLQETTGVGSGVVDMGSSILSEYGIDKPFSRSQESEADLDGLILMAKAGYNPQAAITLWEKMSKLSGAPPEFLSTHPSGETRIKDLKAALPEANALYAQSKK